MDFRLKFVHVCCVALLLFFAGLAVRGCVYRQIVDRLSLPIDPRVSPFHFNETEMQPLPEINETPEDNTLE